MILKKKKILFFIPSLGGGGAEKVLVNLANNLDKSKYDVEVRAMFSNNSNLQFLNPEVRYSHCFGKQFKGNRILLKLFSPKLLFKIFIPQHYDIIISYLEGPGERIVSGCTYNTCKLINWIHVERHSIQNAAVSYRSIQEFQKAQKKFNFTVFVSQTVQDDTLSFLPISHPNAVLYNTIETDTIRLKSKEHLENFELPDGLKVFSIGRLTDAKGFDRLIKAHGRLIKEGYRHNLYILGKGEELTSLQNLALDLGVSSSVHFLGFHSNPYKYLARADLFVCSSRREGFSTAVSEALILGIPIVSTNCSGAKELLGTADEYGIVVENSDEGVYKGYLKMIANPDKLQHYKKMALKRGLEFSVESTVGKVEQMLDTL